MGAATLSAQEPISIFQRIKNNDRVTMGGEYIYQRILENNPFLQRREKGHGNFGAMFVSYGFREATAPYFTLRGRWAAGEIQRSHTIHNRLTHQRFHWSDEAHEWNSELRLGYGFGLGCANQFVISPYFGVGYEGARINLMGRQKFWWWYIPVGFIASYQFYCWTLALDADFGMMADAHYIALDEPLVNNFERRFGNRYRWELELPLTCTWNTCWCNGGWVEAGFVPFWRGWRTREQLQGEQDTASDVATVGRINGEHAFTDAVVRHDQPVATPSILANSWGGRLQIGFNF
jgi:hypothetical protein